MLLPLVHASSAQMEPFPRQTEPLSARPATAVMSPTKIAPIASPVRLEPLRMLAVSAKSVPISSLRHLMERASVFPADPDQRSTQRRLFPTLIASLATLEPFPLETETALLVPLVWSPLSQALLSASRADVEQNPTITTSTASSALLEPFRPTVETAKSVATEQSRRPKELAIALNAVLERNQTATEHNATSVHQELPLFSEDTAKIAPLEQFRLQVVQNSASFVLLATSPTP